MSRTRRLHSDARFRPTVFLSAALAFLALGVLSTGAESFAQDMSRPLPVPSGLKVPATGELATYSKLRNKVGPLQPVEWKLPKGAVAEVAQANGFVSDQNASNVFALELGSVYRFRVSKIDSLPNAAVYPTLELLDRLNPPLGKAWDFPIEISLPMSDIEAALNGALVTRVVFLENAANPANVDASENPEGLTLDVPRGIDPVAAATTRGKVMAIVRIGSRAPDGEPNAEDPFFFGLPRVEFKPVATAQPEAKSNLTPSDVEALSNPGNVK